jgi:hypothetical protein
VCVCVYQEKEGGKAGAKQGFVRGLVCGRVDGYPARSNWRVIETFGNPSASSPPVASLVQVP